jgi:hypothetical protein
LKCRALVEKRHTEKDENVKSLNIFSDAMKWKSFLSVGDLCPEVKKYGRRNIIRGIQSEFERYTFEKP